MAQENLQQMVIPILQTLYNAPDSTSHHIYMTLIVLLILSEDDGFNKSVHQIVSDSRYKPFLTASENLAASASLPNQSAFLILLFICFLDSQKHSLVHRALNIGNITWWPSNFSRNPDYPVQHAEDAR